MRIGLLMATYNGEKYISQQLDSILNQTIRIDEIVISDDGSTDHTVSIIEKYIHSAKDIDIKLVINKKKHGVAGNFENAFYHSTADFLFFSDQDDVWKPNKVEIFLQCLVENPECGLFFSNATVTDAGLIPIGKTVWDFFWNKEEKDNNYFVLNNEHALNKLFRGNFVTGMCMASQRKCIEQIFPLPTNMLHDDILTAYCLLNSKVCAINEETAYYRQHNDSVVGVRPQNPFVSVDKRRNSVLGLIKYSYQNMPIIEYLYNRSYMFDKFACKNDFEAVHFQYSCYKTIRMIATMNRIDGVIRLSIMFISGKYNKLINHKGIKHYFFDLAMVLFVSTKRRRQFFAEIDDSR